MTHICKVAPCRTIWKTPNNYVYDEIINKQKNRRSSQAMRGYEFL